MVILILKSEDVRTLIREAKNTDKADSYFSSEKRRTQSIQEEIFNRVS